MVPSWWKEENGGPARCGTFLIWPCLVGGVGVGLAEQQSLSDCGGVLAVVKGWLFHPLDSWMDACLVLFSAYGLPLSPPFSLSLLPTVFHRIFANGEQISLLCDVTVIFSIYI